MGNRPQPKWAAEHGFDNSNFQKKTLVRKPTRVNYASEAGSRTIPAQ